MMSFLQKFAVLVAGVLQGFDRVVFKGKLKQLYAPEAMHLLLRLQGRVLQCCATHLSLSWRS